MALSTRIAGNKDTKYTRSEMLGAGGGHRRGCRGWWWCWSATKGKRVERMLRGRREGQEMSERGSTEVRERVTRGQRGWRYVGERGRREGSSDAG